MKISFSWNVRFWEPGPSWTKLNIHTFELFFMNIQIPTCVRHSWHIKYICSLEFSHVTNIKFWLARRVSDSRLNNVNQVTPLWCYCIFVSMQYNLVLYDIILIPSYLLNGLRRPEYHYSHDVYPCQWWILFDQSHHEVVSCQDSLLWWDTAGFKGLLFLGRASCYLREDTNWNDLEMDCWYLIRTGIWSSQFDSYFKFNKIVN